MVVVVTDQRSMFVISLSIQFILWKRGFYLDFVYTTQPVKPFC